MRVGSKELSSGSLKPLEVMNLEMSSRFLGVGTQTLEFLVGGKKRELKECVYEVHLRECKQ